MYRAVNNINIAYEYYKEHYDRKYEFIYPEDFLSALRHTGIIVTAMEKSKQYYDIKFGITFLYDRNGSLIKIY